VDSLWNVSSVCALGQERLHIKFYFASVDKVKKLVHIVGRIQFGGSAESTGLSGIEIFRGTMTGNKITDRTKIGEATDGKEYIDNDGFFDIRLQVKNNESIFFYGYRYFLEEFKVSKLFQ